MDELVEWLRAQLDEDERIARAASDGPWRCYRGPEKSWMTKGDLMHPVYTWENAVGTPVIMTAYWADSRHIAEWDPARVLREIEAKRRRLGRHQPERRRLHLLDAEGGTTSFAFYVCTACTPNRTIEHGQDVIEWPCFDVRDDAAVYAERPGYQESWRP